MEMTWYLMQNIAPVERERVLVYDNGMHYIAYYSDGFWYDGVGSAIFSPNACWTDLPRP